jgi:hypothetical protein
MGSYSFPHCELKPNRCAGRKRETNLPSLGSKIAIHRGTHLLRSQAMYAYIPEIERGFFEGVCTPGKATANIRDPPYPSLRGLTLRVTL